MEEILLTFRTVLDPNFTYELGNVWVTVVFGVFNLVVGFILLISLMSPKFRAWPNFHKVGIAFIVFGLLAKSGNQIQYVLTGKFTTEMQWPVQAFDNIGVWIIALTYVLQSLTKK